MTEPTDFAKVEALLPGLEPPTREAGANERAAHRTIVALQAAGLVDEQHAVMLEALLTAARQLDRASTSTRSKDYGVANLLAQLRETYLVLAPAAPEGGDESVWERWNRELNEALADDRRGGTPVRDSS